MKERTGRLISILYRKGQMYFGKALKSCNVGAAEFPVLLYLYQQDGVTQEDLATYMCLDKSAIARIIQSLLSKKYITKVKDDKDLRCNRIYLTNEGAAVRQEIEQALDSWNQLLMDKLDEEGQNQIHDLLMCMVENVKGEK